jgi:hypothetical protein
MNFNVALGALNNDVKTYLRNLHIFHEVLRVQMQPHLTEEQSTMHVIQSNTHTQTHTHTQTLSHTDSHTHTHTHFYAM